MLCVTDHTTTYLILKDQRRWASIGAWLFTLISMGAWLIFTSQVSTIITNRLARDGALWVLVVIIFFCLISGLVLLGIIATRHLTYGIHCRFDKTTETVTLSQIGIFRPIHTVYPIYAINGVDIEANHEMHVYGVFLMLKHGERVPLASFYQVDEEAMQKVVKQIRTFLRG